MSSNSITTSNRNFSLYTIEEFNKLLEDNKPYNKEYIKDLEPSAIETLDNTYLDYNIDLKVLICLKCLKTIYNSISNIIEYLKVS